jgi:hypothetical protein
MGSQADNLGLTGQKKIWHESTYFQQEFLKLDYVYVYIVSRKIIN